jgi:hypothetical protein
VALDDERPARVADGRQQDAQRADQLVGVARHVEAEQDDHPDRPTSRPTSREPPTRSSWSKRIASAAIVSGRAEMRIAANDDDTRSSPNAMSGNGMTISSSAKAAMAGHRDPQPAQCPGSPRERQQHRRGQRHAHEAQEHRRDLVDGDLDEQVRHAPHHRHGSEGDPATAAHRPGP